MWNFKKKALEKQSSEDEFESLLKSNLDLIDKVCKSQAEQRKCKQKHQCQLKTRNRRKYYSGF